MLEDRTGELEAAEESLALADVAAVHAARERGRAADARAWAHRVRNEAERRLRRERELLTELAIHAYLFDEDDRVRAFEAVFEADTTDPTGGDQLLLGEVLDRRELRVIAAEETLTRAHAAMMRAIVEHRRRIEAASTAEFHLAERRAAADRARDAVADALTAFAEARDRVRTAPRGVPVPLGIPLLGPNRLSADDLAGWFASRPRGASIATPIEDIAAWFIEEGAVEGVRGDIAFAQAVLETGGFTNPDSVLRHNYSGIGHCDSCPAGWTFPSAREGVRAQIQLLKSYAVRSPVYRRPLVDRRLRGPAGCCSTWADLTGVWATAEHYGPAVMLLYGSMVDHALGRRAAGIGFEPAPSAADGPRR